jgi:hypothetical protein
LLGRADGAIHTASPGVVTSANLDATVVDAVTSAFAGTGKPYLQISGLWIYGTNSSITEESAFNAPPMVSWKVPIERWVLDATQMRGVVVGVVVVPSAATVTAAAGFPGCFWVHPGTTPAT